MSFADELKKINPEKVKREQKQKEIELSKKAREEKKQRLKLNIENILTYAKRDGHLNNKSISGFFCEMTLENYFGLVLCSENDINVGRIKPKDEKEFLFCYSAYAQGKYMRCPMSDYLHVMREWYMEEYRTSGFCSLAKEVLSELGFKNIECKLVTATYYYKAYDEFVMKKKTTVVPFFKFNL